MNVRNYRFERWSGDGTLLPTVLRDQTRMLPTGLRCSLTPDGDCVELTMNARNGPAADGPGFGLSNMQVVRLSFAETETPAEGDWLPVWYGTLRVGGNPYDYDGESMIFRGMSRRLEEVTVPPGVYAEADAGAVIRQMAQAVFSSGQLGVTTGGPPPGSQLVSYDASLVPDLGFTFKLADNQEVLFGKLLDQIVADALSKLSLILVWGVRPDGRFFFKVARTDVLNIPISSRVTFGLAAPSAETPCTAVLWTIGKNNLGHLIYYRSTDTTPAALKAGSYVKEVVVGADLDPWAVLTDFTLTFDEGSGPVAASADARGRISEKIDTDGVLLLGSTSSARVSATYTVNTFTRRLYLQVAINHFAAGGGTLTVAQPGVPTVSYTAADGMMDGVQSFTRFTATLYDLPVGTVIAVSGGPDAALSGALGQAQVGLREIRGDVPNSALLDGLAKYYYTRPTVAPADIESGGFVAPSDLCGKVSTPLPNGAGDYIENVAAYEYRLTAAEGLILGVQAGQADDPARLAAASLIKSLANKAAVTGAQTSA
jgi:hypothetical protein